MAKRRKKSSKGQAALKKIRHAASNYLKQHPGANYQTQLKKFGKEYKQGTLSGTKKKSHHVTKKRRVGKAVKSHVDNVDRKKVDITIGRVPMRTLKSEMIKRKEEQLAFALLHRDQTSLKSYKNKLSKQINRLRQDLRNLKD